MVEPIRASEVAALMSLACCCVLSGIYMNELKRVKDKGFLCLSTYSDTCSFEKLQSLAWDNLLFVSAQGGCFGGDGQIQVGLLVHRFLKFILNT